MTTADEYEALNDTIAMAEAHPNYREGHQWAVHALVLMRERATYLRTVLEGKEPS